jgi:hypothetical protein
VTFDDVLARLRDTAGSHALNPLATEDDLAATEAAIDKKLPRSFQRFVCEFSNGGYLFGVQEVSGVGNVDNPRPIHRNEWHYGEDAGFSPDDQIPIRQGGSAAASSLLPFSLDSNGNEWCFIVDGTPEPAVAYFSSPLNRDPTKNRLYAHLSGGFTEWLAILIQEPLDEVIRTIYRDDDSVLYDELMLG